MGGLLISCRIPGAYSSKTGYYINSLVSRSAVNFYTRPRIGIIIIKVRWPWDPKNIKRHTAHTIVSEPNPKQWIIVHTSDLIMIIRQSIYSLNQHKEMDKLKTRSPIYCIMDNTNYAWSHSYFYNDYFLIIKTASSHWNGHLMVHNHNSMSTLWTRTS